MSKTYRPLHPGMGQAVAERTILREKNDGNLENWGDVADRVARGNSLLVESYGDTEEEYKSLRDHIATGALLMSGRHLQHGDAQQHTRNMEVFTNCSTAATANLSFYLLLNGSGVGRCYDDALTLVNWNNAPEVHCVLDEFHPDYCNQTQPWEVYSMKNSKVFMVPDSREGWAEAVELWECLTYNNPDKIEHLILDFSQVRCSGSPIGGMQNRPASGPAPLIDAFKMASEVCSKGYEPWKATMYVDHYFAECVLVGGARRAARIAVKHWADEGIFDFITIKKDGDLWSANNSVGLDGEFWDGVTRGDAHAIKVRDALITSSYSTGEPGNINLHKLQRTPLKSDELTAEGIGSAKFKLSAESQQLLTDIFKEAKNSKNPMIVNPCGEISLSVWGGFCVIADVVPYHCDTLDQAEDAFRAAARALIRVNTMDSIYNQEVKRTNRIGVGITGIHEFAWKFFKLGFRDLIDESKSAEFWSTISRFRDAVIEESKEYAKILGVNVPHTMLTIKPAGTTSKLFGLTEGWHLPSMAFYLRWTQFRSNDPLVEKYKKAGYPTKELVKYKGTTIVGFPTETEIGNLDLGSKLVTAAEATPEEQYQWLKLGEEHWLGDEFGNQISYTLKYHPEQVSKEAFSDMFMKYQSEIKCCSVMPHGDESEMLKLYEYLPEQRIEWEDYVMMKQGIRNVMEEDVDKVHIDCDNGACPVDFNK